MFEIQLATLLVRLEDEAFLIGQFPDYVPLGRDPNPSSSLWLKRLVALSQAVHSM